MSSKGHPADATGRLGKSTHLVAMSWRTQGRVSWARCRLPGPATISHCEGALRPARHTPVLSGDLDATGESAVMGRSQAVNQAQDIGEQASRDCDLGSAPTGSIPDEKSVRFLQIFSSKFQRDVQERLLTPVRHDFCLRNVILAIHYLATKTSPPGIGARGGTA